MTAMLRLHHWRVRIQDARDEVAIAHVIHDYRLTLPQTLVEMLPGECREAIDATDIPDAAFTLLQAEMKFRASLRSRLCSAKSPTLMWRQRSSRQTGEH